MVFFLSHLLPLMQPISSFAIDVYNYFTSLSPIFDKDLNAKNATI